MPLNFPESHSGKRDEAQKINIISESRLYGLIMRSNKPEAKKFSRWVRHEVLPQIIKNGSYSVNQINNLELKKNQENRWEIQEARKRFHFWNNMNKAIEKVCETIKLGDKELSGGDIFRAHCDKDDIRLLLEIFEAAKIHTQHRARVISDKISVLNQLFLDKMTNNHVFIYRRR